jgi:hypothetical protein
MTGYAKGNCIRLELFVIFTKCHLGERIKEDEMDRASRVHSERCIKCFVVEPEKIDHSEDLGVRGRKILKWIIDISVLGVWIKVIWPKIRFGSRFLLKR